MSFTRRYSSDPGLGELSKIEGVVIIDNDPPPASPGGTTGFVTVIGEFEDGPYNAPTELLSGTDFQNQFGGFGFTYDGLVSNNPCARSRKADGALAPEYWNGNGFVACVSKKFKRTAVVRVDTSVGSVQFTRRASVLGNNKVQWDLAPAQQLTLDIGGGPVSAIFNATIASLVSGAQTFPTGFTGGEKMVIVVDEGTPQQIQLTVTFLAGDTTQAAVISRINSTFGFTLATANSSTVTRLDGRVVGTSGHVRVVSQDTAVGTALGWSTVAANGGGNVANIDTVTFAEVKSIVEAAVAGTTVERTPSGLLRVAANTASTITPTAATTALDFGFVLGTAGASATGLAGTIPAGTRVRNGGGTEWVTCQTVAVTAANPGPYSVKVRPGLDDGSVGSGLAGAVNSVPFALELAAFSVINAQPLSAALTEAAIDAAYLTAFDATLSPNKATAKSDLFVSARQSNAVRQKGRQNAVDASNAGLTARKFLMRPPLGTTTRAQAISTSAQPGSGVYRSDRVIYGFPGVAIFLPQVASRGTSGGAGFTADGIIDVGADTFEAADCAQVNPEENPGQIGTSMLAVLGVERGNPDVQAMTMDDYVAFKAAGIAAIFMEDGVATIQSGVVNVDPATSANLANIARRRMADYIQDTLAVALKPFVKKLATRDRRALCLGVVEDFLAGLAAVGAKTAQRIDSYQVDGKSGNTPEALARGIFRIIIRVKTLSSLDVIVLDTTIGETVTFADLSPALAA